MKRLPGMSGACEAAMRALVLAGLPTTSTRTSLAAPALSASPCGLKMPPLADSRSPRSMPAVRGRAPTSSATLVPSKACAGVGGDVDAREQREGAVVELHRGALGGLERRLDLEQAQAHRGVGAEQLAGGDAEQQRVADLAGGAGDGDVDGCVAIGRELRFVSRRTSGTAPPGYEARERPARVGALAHGAQGAGQRRAATTREAEDQQDRGVEAPGADDEQARRGAAAAPAAARRPAAAPAR